MGKAERNELRKIRATYYNGVAVAGAVVGVVGPLVAVISADKLIHLKTWTETFPILALLFLSMLYGGVISFWFHYQATRSLRGIED